MAKSLLNSKLTENKQVFLSDFVTTPRDIVSALESQLGEKFSIEKKESAPALKELRAKFDAGEFNATYPILALSFVGDVDVGYDFPKEYEIWNEKLGLPKPTLEEVVKEAIDLANSTV